MPKPKKSPVVSPIMKTLSAYIASVPDQQLPPEITERAKLHFLDTVSAMISGSRLLPGRRAIDYARAQGGVREACVLGTNLVTSAANAALANGMLAHADETDDAYYIALVHPGCSVVPAALAMAERERGDGSALLRAIVLGYDICARISKLLGVEHFRSAGHSTHSFGGTFGSAAAAGALARLDADRVRYLLSYAAQQASGLSCWARDVEHIEKAFHFGGMPARNGVTAATMVASGFTAVEDVFAGDRGFFHAYESYVQPQRLVRGLGREFDILQTAIKRWPVGYPIQAPLDALSNLIANYGITAEEVDRIVVSIDEQGARTVNKRRMASINLQHLMSMMLVDGEITFASAHDEERVHDPAVVRLKKRIELLESQELSKAKTTQAVVEIITCEGERHKYHTRAVRGSATNPMNRDEVALKSRDLLIPVLGSRRTERLIDAIWNIEGIADMRELRPLLCPARGR